MAYILNKFNKVESARSNTASVAIANSTPRWGTIRPVSHLAMAAGGAQCFRNIFAVPKAGWCSVRARYITDYTGGTSTITATAVAGGRALADDNPLTAAGTPATWSVAGATTLPAASATLATDGKFGRAVSTWMSAFVPPASDRPGPGYITVSTLPSGTNTRLIVSSEIKQYTTTTGLELTGMEYRAVIAGSGTDYTTTNQGAFVSNGQTWGPDYNFCVGIDWLPMQGTPESLHMYGDSIVDGFCNAFNTPAVQSYGFSYGAVAVNLLQKANRMITYASFGSQGKDGPYFHGRLAEHLTDPEFVANYVGIAGFSINGLLTLSAIDASLTTAFAQYDAAEARGCKPFLITVCAASGDTADRLAQRIRGNAKIRTSGRRYFDLEAVLMDFTASPLPKILTANTYDTTHPNRVGHRLAGAALATFLGTF